MRFHPLSRPGELLAPVRKPPQIPQSSALTEAFAGKRGGEVLADVLLILLRSASRCPTGYADDWRRSKNSNSAVAELFIQRRIRFRAKNMVKIRTRSNLPASERW